MSKEDACVASEDIRFFLKKKRGYPYTQLEDAVWIRDHLSCMQFTLPYEESAPHLLVIWFKEFSWLDKWTSLNHPEMWNFSRLNYILQDVFGAYIGGGPLANPMDFDGGWGFKQSYMFWNTGLIEHARRVFPFPPALQPGKPTFLGESLAEMQRIWERLGRFYDRSPEELYLQP